MCFGGSKPSTPPPAPVLPPPVAPQAPRAAAAPVASPNELTIDRQVGVKKRESSKEQTGQVSKGTSQLRVPLNIGTSKSGGLNI
jgi:hypothetical protein